MVTIKKIPRCKACGEVFDEWKQLALHIMSTKKGHHQGKKWAATFIAKNTLRPDIKLKRIPEYDKKEPDPEMVRIANEHAAKYALSGRTEIQTCYCLGCKKTHRAVVPIEYSASPYFWRIDGHLVVPHEECRGVMRR